MRLVVVLSFLVRKDQVEGDLVGLVHHRAVARDHFPDVKVEDAGDGLEKLVGAGNEFIRGRGFVGLGPKNDNV